MSDAILAFQAQLSGIMETVLKTAVFEITWLVESSFQAEVVRSRQEVEVLRRRLQAVEGRRARGGGEVPGEARERRATGTRAGVEEGRGIKEEREAGRGPSTCLLDQSEEATPTCTRVTETSTCLEGDRFDPKHKRTDPGGARGNRCLQGSLKAQTDGPQWGPGNRCLQGSLKVAVEPSAHPLPERDTESEGSLELVEECGIGGPGSERALEEGHGAYERLSALGTGDSDEEGEGQTYGRGPEPALREPYGDRASEDGDGIQIENVISLSRPQHCAANHGRRKALGKARDSPSRPKQQQLGASGRPGQTAFGSAGEARAGVLELPGLPLCSAGDKPISCVYCGKSFSYVSRLKIHLLKHTGEKPFSCTQCGKRFTIARNLERHQHIHWGDAAFCCAQCGKRFKRADHLKVHQRVHTGERPYSCAQCGKCFRFSGDLNTHRRVHTGEKPYCCTLCGNRFSQLRQLKAHQRSHKGLGRFDQLIT
ncbi:hypothetical protein AAFF_G00261520 [Aldrovandia affinis]|uniref:C2H2-type domain-containing protein n=1 Tax=Aldrovandia affinis TaxID=143900 RepID=A0AAD7W2T9_9TELE|nr:hypothetical protein AAFF_G00261520 [Aldrovandia affinis]